SPFSLLERAIVAGDEIDAPPDAPRRFAVARVGGAFLLHAEPREQWPPPALVGSDVDGGADSSGSDGTASERHRLGHKARQRIVSSPVGTLAGKVVGVRKLLGASAVAQRFEAGAIVELEARRAHGAAHELGACDEVRAAGARELATRGLELRLGGGRVARPGGAPESPQGPRRVQLPVQRLLPAAACRDKENQGSRISESRWKGHLRLISSMSPLTLRRLASTSARNAPRSCVAALALPLTDCASARILSTRFRLSRSSPRISFAWLTARCVPSTTPPGPRTR